MLKIGESIVGEYCLERWNSVEEANPSFSGGSSWNLNFANIAHMYDICSGDCMLRLEELLLMPAWSYIWTNVGGVVVAAWSTSIGLRIIYDGEEWGRVNIERGDCVLCCDFMLRLIHMFYAKTDTYVEGWYMCFILRFVYTYIKGLRLEDCDLMGAARGRYNDLEI